ncbi:MAG: hypothetical protein CSA11_01055 [Chloroflexi bacterium]|nr:MAG: hypothetical protein CSB13_10765 [Chloroflexota bacterium]PIE82301.1 MAG: hypothetical protein CSA11_01055 [Chloroflexota bacterium]
MEPVKAGAAARSADTTSSPLVPYQRNGYAPLFLLWIIVMLGACRGEPEPRPTLAPTAAAVQTFTPLPTLSPTPSPTATLVPTETATPVLQYPTATSAPSATPPPTATSQAVGVETVIGYSVEERPLLDYRFNNGPHHIVLVGGIHGGYDWNTIALAYALIDYFRENPHEIPAAVTLHIVPSANPDGMAWVAQETEAGDFADLVSVPQAELLPGRFNANEVDLSRNWDCQWHRSSYWEEQWVSGGREPFSEPETQALRDFLVNQPANVVAFWYSGANGVFGSGCGTLFAPSVETARIYSLASGYPVYEKFDDYFIYGNAVDWLAREQIPAFMIALKSHDDTEFNANLDGLRALMAAYQ